MTKEDYSKVPPPHRVASAEVSGVELDPKSSPNSLQIRSFDITPPPELVQQWATASPVQSNDENWAYELFIAHHAAQWGADQELEACCEWVTMETPASELHLRSARRPKPPSLKEEALKGFDTIAGIVLDEYYGTTFYEKYKKVTDTIRRALEALPE